MVCCAPTNQHIEDPAEADGAPRKILRMVDHDARGAAHCDTGLGEYCRMPARAPPLGPSEALERMREDLVHEPHVELCVADEQPKKQRPVQLAAEP